MLLQNMPTDPTLRTEARRSAAHSRTGVDKVLPHSAAAASSRAAGPADMSSLEQAHTAKAMKVGRPPPAAKGGAQEGKARIAAAAAGVSCDIHKAASRRAAVVTSGGEVEPRPAAAEDVGQKRSRVAAAALHNKAQQQRGLASSWSSAGFRSPAGAFTSEDAVAAIAGGTAGGAAAFACEEAVAAAVQPQGLSAAGVGGGAGKGGGRTGSLATLSVQLPAVQREEPAAVTRETAGEATTSTAAEQEGRPQGAVISVLEPRASADHKARLPPTLLPATLSGKAPQLQATAALSLPPTREQPPPPPAAAGPAAPRDTAASTTEREVTPPGKSQQGHFFLQSKLYQHSPPRPLPSSRDYLVLPKELVLHCYPKACALGQEVSLVVAVPREVAWLAREVRAVADRAIRQEGRAAAAAAVTSAAALRAIAEAAGGAQQSREMTTTAVTEQQEEVVLRSVHRQAGCRFLEVGCWSTKLVSLKRSLEPYPGWHLVFLWQVCNRIQPSPDIFMLAQRVHNQRVSLVWDEVCLRKHPDSLDLCYPYVLQRACTV